MSRLLPVELQGPAGRIEALLQEREQDEPPFVAVVCHPHPRYGGTMHNKVAHRLASTLFARGGALMRFNFRGVGKSEGVHDRGRGELQDALVVLDTLRRRHPAAKVWVGRVLVRLVGGLAPGGVRSRRGTADHGGPARAHADL